MRSARVRCATGSCSVCFWRRRFCLSVLRDLIIEITMISSGVTLVFLVWRRSIAILVLVVVVGEDVIDVSPIG